MPGQREFNRELFAELVLYIAQRSREDPQFGKTKLAKLLAFTDFRAFEQTGQPLTGATYVKLEFGPAPRELPGVLSDLMAREQIEERREDYYGYDMTRYVARGELRGDVLTPEARGFADEVMERFAWWNNSEISTQAHRQFVGWQHADDMEAIPYESYWLSPLAPTDAEIRRGQQLAAAVKRERGLPMDGD